MNLKEESKLLYDPPLVLKKAGDNRRTLEVSVCDAPHQFGVVSPDQLLFFAHICCWRAVSQQYPLSTLHLYKLAQQTRPILCFEKTRLLSVQLPNQNLADTDLASLLFRVNSLPLELQREVLQFLSCHLTSSLIQALQTATFLKRITRKGSSQKTVGLLHGNAAQLRGSTISMFGETCLHRIHFTPEPSKGGLSISIQTGAIRGVQFSLGIYGLKAVRMVYWDGSSSPWLGEPGTGYCGTVHGSLDLLTLVYDVYQSSRNSKQLLTVF